MMYVNVTTNNGKMMKNWSFSYKVKEEFAVDLFNKFKSHSVHKNIRLSKTPRKGSKVSEQYLDGQGT